MTEKEIWDQIILNITKYRKEKGYTQEQIADRLFISKSYYSKMEAPNCNKKFSLELIVKICELLDININEIFFFDC